VRPPLKLILLKKFIIYLNLPPNDRKKLRHNWAQLALTYKTVLIDSII